MPNRLGVPLVWYVALHADVGVETENVACGDVDLAIYRFCFFLASGAMTYLSKYFNDKFYAKITIITAEWGLIYYELRKLNEQ